MKILLIGVQGQLGSDLKKFIPRDQLVPLTHDDIEIKDRQSVFSCLREYPESIVLNTAAYNRVDDCETHFPEAFAVNVYGVNHLADACLEYNSILVHLSTDYVFGRDRFRKKPYTEDDREGPVNMYGASKLAGENLVLYKLKRYFIIRTSGLFGAAGLSGKGVNFIETMIRLGREKGRVQVVNDQRLTPTYTKHLAENIWRLIQTDAYGLYHITSQNECSWYELAKKTFQFLKMDVECLPCTSKEFPTPAERPKYSALENARLQKLGLDTMKTWEEGLLEYLSEKGYL